MGSDYENFLVAAIPGGIEAQEKQGQVNFVNNETLPIKFSTGSKADLEKAGVVFGERVDELFCKVTLPAGWCKIATSHSMHSSLVDDQGRTRASIFYKAAFYDRHADITVCARYGYSMYGLCDMSGNPINDYDAATHRATVILDGGKIVHLVAIREAGTGPNVWPLIDEQEKNAIAWLDAHYPNWRSKTAYWDEA